MKLSKFYMHDFYEGIVRYWYRYLLTIFVVVAGFISFTGRYKFMEEFDRYTTCLSDFLLDFFRGVKPYTYNPADPSPFFPPYIWLFFYLLLIFSFGSFLEESYRGFGSYLMVKGGKRGSWWLSKCLWCVTVNVIYFTFTYIVTIGCSWALNGEIRMNFDPEKLDTIFGKTISDIPADRLLMLMLVMPFLTGICCSFIQMTATLIMGSTWASVMMISLLVLGSYYSNSYNPYEYSMASRYYVAYGSDKFASLDIGHGIMYLLIVTAAMMLVGYLLIRKKNLIQKNQTN